MWKDKFVIFHSPGPVALDLGFLQFRWYGILIAAGVLLAYGYALHEARRRGTAAKPLEDMVFWVVLAGMAGARFYYVFFNFSYYVDHPLEIFQIWKGGLAIHGALLGGALASLVFFRLHRLPFLLYADVVMPGVLLAQVVGRWGNFFNSEAFGAPTNLPWKLFIPAQNRPEGFENFDFFHPAFLYESLWDLAGFALLVAISRVVFHTAKGSNLPDSRVRGNDSGASGTVFFAYLAWYSLGRFFIESIRLDSLFAGPLRAAQLMSAVLFAVGVFGLLQARKKDKILS